MNKQTLGEPGHLLERCFAELEFDRLGVRTLVALVRREHTAKRVVGACRVSLELSRYLATVGRQAQETPDGDQQSDGAQRQDAVTNDATLIDLLAKRRCLYEQSEDAATRDVNAKRNVARFRAHQVACSAEEAAWRLTLQFTDGALARVVLEDNHCPRSG